MAGEWIPVRVDLFTSPRILRISRDAGVVRFEAVGLMVAFWAWAGAQTADGELPGVALEDLPEVIGGTLDFWRAVAAAGWLDITPDGLALPEFDKYLDRAAKARLQDSERKRRVRKMSGSQPDKNRTTEQNSTEQNKKEEERDSSEPGKAGSKPPPSSSSPDSLPFDPEADYAGPEPPVTGPSRLTLPAAPEVILLFPAVGNGPREWPLTGDKLAEYADSFPGIDALAECKRALQWIRDNPTRQKTAKGMPAFLNRWLTKAQDSGKHYANGESNELNRPGRIEAPAGKYQHLSRMAMRSATDSTEGKQ